MGESAPGHSWEIDQLPMACSLNLHVVFVGYCLITVILICLGMTGSVNAGRDVGVKKAIVIL